MEKDIFNKELPDLPEKYVDRSIDMPIVFSQRAFTFQMSSLRLFIFMMAAYILGIITAGIMFAGLK